MNARIIDCCVDRNSCCRSIVLDVGELEQVDPKMSCGLCVVDWPCVRKFAGTRNAFQLGLHMDLVLHIGLPGIPVAETGELSVVRSNVENASTVAELGLYETSVVDGLPSHVDLGVGVEWGPEHRQPNATYPELCLGIPVDDVLLDGLAAVADNAGQVYLGISNRELAQAGCRQGDGRENQNGKTLLPQTHCGSASCCSWKHHYCSQQAWRPALERRSSPTKVRNSEY